MSSLQIIHRVASWYLGRRLQRIDFFRQHPDEAQKRLFQSLCSRAAHTQWGKKYGFAEGISPAQFRERVPVSSYEQLYPWIERAMKGEPDVLWPGRTFWFSKSSGTTNDRSKYIPMTEASFDEMHFSAGRDMLALYVAQRPESQLFAGKGLTISGSHDSMVQGACRAGDLSAVLLENLPVFYQIQRVPDKRIALLKNWEDKLEPMLREALEEDLTSFVGVPTWTLLLGQRALELTGKSNLFEVWPNLEVFFTGGVNFAPYRQAFQQLLPGTQMQYVNIYNASEGFLGIQDDLSRDDLLLLLDHGIYYEFMPLEELGREHPRTLDATEVSAGESYVLVISTVGGLWRYVIGDTVEVTATLPLKIRITGRTKQYINVFGEELMVDNAEKGISAACAATGASIADYSAGPVYASADAPGCHEWIVEFLNPPDDPGKFAAVLDQNLRSLNSDYDAKRSGDRILGPLRLRVAPPGTFYAWMKQRGKLGGQHKAPRLANDRRYLDDMIRMMG